MNNQPDLSKFEFLLTLEGKIVCQRFFNVKNYNPDSKGSTDLYEYIKNISTQISNDLKVKTLDYLAENRDYFYGLDVAENPETNLNENFLIEIKLVDDVFIRRIFPAYFYHPKVRYTVDIRPSLKLFLSDLTEILSAEELETNYLNYQLV